MNKKINFKQEILAKIKPSAEEQQRFKETISIFLPKLNQALKAAKLQAEAILGGSGAKNTWLAGNYDLDIFVLFDYKKYQQKSDKLSDLLAPVLKKAFPAAKVERLHGSRDYFQLSFQQLNFEIVPILKIKKSAEAINITDVSPLHAEWVNKATRKNKSLSDEIRLAKKFLKANKLYGAESYLNGFSGYVTEILVINYGSLENLLKAALKWKEKSMCIARSGCSSQSKIKENEHISFDCQRNKALTSFGYAHTEKEVIDAGKNYPKKDALFHLNKSKQVSPIIVVDPVDKSRNAAAALSEEKVFLLKKIAADYLKNPGANFFEEKKINPGVLEQEAKNRKQNLVYLELESFLGKEDVEGAKLLKSFEFLKTRLAAFGIKKADWQWDKKSKMLVYFLLEKKELPQVEIRNGPPLSMKEYVEDFRKKNKNSALYEEKGRIMAKIEVKNYLLKYFLNGLLREKYFMGKIKGVERVEIC